MSVLLAAFDPVPAAKGASAHVLRNHRILTDAGHDVSLLTLGDHPLPGVRHLVADPPGATWLERAVAFRAHTERVLQRTPFDIVHARSPFEGLAIAPGTPSVAEVNALYSIELPAHYPDLLGLPGFRDRMRAAELLWLERASVVLTPSPITALYLQDLGVPHPVVVPNAPSIPRLPRVPRDGPVRLVYIGTLAPWQGLHQALRCLSRLLHLDWELLVLTGSKARWVQKLAAKQGLADRVTVRDPLPPDDLARLLATSDIGLAPLTPSERNVVQGCMPVKILDYLRAGLAVLAPDLPVCTELLPAGHPTYRAWSRQSLTAALEHLLTTDRSALSAAAQAHVEARFHESVQRDALLDAYARL